MASTTACLSRLATPAGTGRPRPRTTLLVTCSGNASRRSACLGIGIGAVLQQHGLAGGEEDEPANNGWWLTEFPLPVRKIVNKELNNAETGTRSFVRNGIYIADIGGSFAAHAYRLRSSALDLLALEDLLGKEKDASRYVDKYLRLKSTFMYYDFDMLLTAVNNSGGDKQQLLGLATRLFDSFEALHQALTRKDDPDIASCYAATKPILQEVMDTMAA